MRKITKALAMLIGITLIAQACDYIDSPAGSAMLDKLHEKRLDVGEALLVVTRGGVDEIMPYYSYDIDYQDPIVEIDGKKDMKEFLYRIIEGDGMDLTTTVLDETLIDDTYCATWVMEGLFNGIPYYAHGISIFKFKPYSHQVYYQRDYYSEGDIMATIEGMDQMMFFFREQYKCSVVPDHQCQLPPPTAAASTQGSEPCEPNPTYNNQLEVARLLVQLDRCNYKEVSPFLDKAYNYHDPIVSMQDPAKPGETITLINSKDKMNGLLGNLFDESTSEALITVVEDETLVDDIYMATWTMSGNVDGAELVAPGMSIVKFEKGTTNVLYSRDYYSEGDVMLGVPQLKDAVENFRIYYKCDVDPQFDCPL
ncbi:nuclear transport factor 2 family protein [Carboxylicivirga sp. M1479]|uniref:nuclear transport factor 2 family protein n=1 Tax=Carboxylicivirga sp. M1479 TaxID=2594476 RepID=UPI0011774A8E|nr:nuclear transport factor 2 family protein [Carboxylicivirga sp. M1479]TRX72303.1 nuclear transport factor 2 family protein [Carboxylicivirga sp. M1479]